MADIIKFPNTFNPEPKLPDFLIDDDTPREVRDAFNALMNLKTPSLPENTFVYQGYLELVKWLFWELDAIRIEDVFCSNDCFDFKLKWEKRHIIWLVNSWIYPNQIAELIRDTLKKLQKKASDIITIIVDPYGCKISLYMNWEIENIQIPYEPDMTDKNFEL